MTLMPEETRTDRALAMYAVGIPMAEIIEETRLKKSSIKSCASRQGVCRPKAHMRDEEGLLDMSTLEMDIHPDAIDEAANYWGRVNRRHAQYWNQQKRERS